MSHIVSLYDSQCGTADEMDEERRAAVMDQLVVAYEQGYVPKLERLSFEGDVRVRSILRFLEKMPRVEEVHISGLLRPKICVCRVMDSVSVCNYVSRWTITWSGGVGHLKRLSLSDCSRPISLSYIADTFPGLAHLSVTHCLAYAWPSDFWRDMRNMKDLFVDEPLYLRGLSVEVYGSSLMDIHPPCVNVWVHSCEDCPQCVMSHSVWLSVSL